jgi:hypothetical protein
MIRTVSVIVTGELAVAIVIDALTSHWEISDGDFVAVAPAAGRVHVHHHES